MSLSRWRTASLACAVLCALASPADAALKLCNRTSYVLYAATAFATDTDTATQGWTRIVPGSCQIAIKERLAAPAYYVYARTSLAHSGASRAWGGTRPFCVRNADFSLRTPLTAPRCPSDDTFDLPFAPVDAHRAKSWTMTFDETPALASMKDAEIAGLKRLLRDQGARIGAIDAKPDKAGDAAMAGFRKRLNMAANAGSTDLFDALETEALKTAAPSGYSVCNDTANPIWVALGQKLGDKWMSRGWWKIAAGGCAKTIADALATDRIFLLAQKSDGAPIVSGPAKFCTTGIEFEIEGRAHCAARGLIETGFAETLTKGLSGVAAHVGERGLVAAPKSYSGTPK